MHAQLCSKAVGGRGLARGARARKQNRFRTSFANHIGNLRKTLFVQRLVNANKLAHLTGLDKLVEVGDSFTAHKLSPSLALGVNRKEVGHLTIVRHLVGIVCIGENKDKSLGRGQDLPRTQKARRGCHFPIEIVGKQTALVNVKRLLFAVFEQTCLIILTDACIVIDGIGGGYSAATERNVLGNDALDLCFHRLCRKVLGSADFNVNARINGTVHFGTRIRPTAAQSQKENKLRGAAVSVAPDGVTVSKQANTALGCRHCLANDLALGNILMSHGNIVQSKYATCDFCRQRVARKRTRHKSHLGNNIQKRLPRFYGGFNSIYQ